MRPSLVRCLFTVVCTALCRLTVAAPNDNTVVRTLSGAYCVTSLLQAVYWPRPYYPELKFYPLTTRCRCPAQVTCGTVIKLQHIGTNHHLHSHEVAYGSGSGQQSVTATSAGDDAGSYWVVKGPEVHLP